MFFARISSSLNFVYLLLVSYIKLEDFRYPKLISDIRNYHVFHRFQHETRPFVINCEIDDPDKRKAEHVFFRKKSICIKSKFNILYNIIYSITIQLRDILLLGFFIILQVSERPVGRPQRGYATKVKLFHIRKDIAEKLEADAKITGIPQSNIIEVALERHFDFSAQTDEKLFKKKMELEQELSGVTSILLDREKRKEQERRQNEKEQKELIELFKQFCRMLENLIANKIVPPMGNLNKNYGLIITEETFQRICSLHQKGQFTIEDFKKLRSGEAI